VFGEVAGVASEQVTVELLKAKRLPSAGLVNGLEACLACARLVTDSLSRLTI